LVIKTKKSGINLNENELTVGKSCYSVPIEFYIEKRRGKEGNYVGSEVVEYPEGFTINTAVAWVNAFDCWFVHANGEEKERPLTHIRFSPDLEDIPNTRKFRLKLEAHLSDENGDDYWQGWAYLLVMMYYESE